MTSDMPRVLVRIDTVLRKKLLYIADFEDRTLTAQIRHILKIHVEEYEKKFGEIKVDE